MPVNVQGVGIFAVDILVEEQWLVTPIYAIDAYQKGGNYKMATVIRVTGETYEIKNPTLMVMQDICGGYVEALKLGDGNYMVVNEEGLMKKLPLNPKASYLYGRGEIVGNVIICSKKEL